MPLIWAYHCNLNIWPCLLQKYLSTERRKQLFGKRINQGSTMSIIIDETSTISYKIVLIIYLSHELQEFEDNLMAFVDLVRQEGKAPEIIYQNLLLTHEKMVPMNNISMKNLLDFVQACGELGREERFSKLLGHFNRVLSDSLELRIPWLTCL